MQRDSLMIKVVFVAPIVLLLAGITVYFIVIPNIYGQVISISDWLYSDYQNIIDIIGEQNATDAMKNYFLIIKAFWYLWFAAFITALFFVGRHFQKKPEPDAKNAILVKKEAYLLVQDITAALKIESQKSKGRDLNLLMDSVKRLEEKLFVESDFGYGKEAVINCENNIARQLEYLLDSVPHISSGNMEENIAELSKVVINVNSLLRKRTELKRR